MDISKLPKLSNSPAPPPSDQPTPPMATPVNTPPIAPVSYVNTSAAVAAEVWISIALGLLVLCIYPNTIKYVAAKFSGSPAQIFADPTRPFPAKCDFILYTDGTKVMYREMTLFWSDAAITAFAIVLILDGFVLWRVRSPTLVKLTMALTTAASLGNLFYLIKTMDQGLPIMSALAVVIGGYIAMTQWATVKKLRAASPARRA